MIKAVIFDRDGMIINSEKTHVECVVKAFKEFGIEISEEEKEYIVGRHTKDYMAHFMKKYSFPEEDFFKTQRECFYKLYNTIELFPDTIALIKELSKKYPLGLTTNGSRMSTDLLINRAKLQGLFKAIVTSDDYSKRKPDPEPYSVTAKKLKFKPEECVVIEDSSVGVESAKRAGMKCIAVPNEYTKHQDFSKADLVVDSVTKITEELLSSI